MHKAEGIGLKEGEVKLLWKKTQPDFITELHNPQQCEPQCLTTFHTEFKAVIALFSLLSASRFALGVFPLIQTLIYKLYLENLFKSPSLY